MNKQIYVIYVNIYIIKMSGYPEKCLVTCIQRTVLLSDEESQPIST